MESNISKSKFVWKLSNIWNTDLNVNTICMFLFIVFVKLSIVRNVPIVIGNDILP